VLLAVVALLIAGGVRLLHGRVQPTLPPAPSMDDSAAVLPASPPAPPSPDLNKIRSLHAATLLPLPATDIPAHLQAAQTAQRLGDLFTAKRLLEAALKQEPNSIPTRRMLADLLRQSGLFAEAKRLALQLHAEQPKDLDSFVALAEIADAENHHDEIFDWLAKAHTAIDPTVENLVNLAHHYQDWDDFTDAKALTAEALRLAPGDENAMLQRASILVEHGEMVEALPLLEDLTAHHPQNSYACRLLAVVLTNPNSPRQDFDRARTLLEKAAELNRTDPVTYRVIAVVYRKQRLYRLAAQCYDALLQLDPNSLEGRFGLGQVYALLGKADWSREQFAIYAKLQARDRKMPLFDVAIRHHPTDPRFHMDKARYLESQGDLTGALAEAETAEMLAPGSKSSGAMKEILNCYALLGWPPFEKGKQ